MGTQISDCCATQALTNIDPSDKHTQIAKTKMLNYWAYNKINTADQDNYEYEQDQVNPEAEGYKQTELKETESPHPFTPSDNDYDNDNNNAYMLQLPSHNKPKINKTIWNKIHESQIKNTTYLINDKQEKNINQMLRSRSSPLAAYTTQLSFNKLIQSQQENNDEFIAKYGAYFTNSTNTTQPTYPTISSQEIPLEIEDSLYDDMTQNSLISPPKNIKGRIGSHTSASYEPSAPILQPQKTPILQQKSGSFHHDHEYDNNDENCQNVSSCKAIKRIIRALKWYQMSQKNEGKGMENKENNNYNNNNIKDKRDKILLNKIFGSGYDKYLLDDYQHILNHHLIQCMIDITDNEYELICTEINKQIEPCDIKRCIGYQRFQQIVKKDLSQCPQHVFCIDFMDLIHCYLMHNQYL